MCVGGKVGKSLTEGKEDAMLTTVYLCLVGILKNGIKKLTIYQLSLGSDGNHDAKSGDFFGSLSSS